MTESQIFGNDNMNCRLVIVAMNSKTHAPRDDRRQVDPSVLTYRDLLETAAGVVNSGRSVRVGDTTIVSS